MEAPPNLLRQSSLLRARIETVRAFREKSSRPQTKELAATPALFGEIRQPNTPYLLIPKVSSENRSYIPIGFLSPEDIASGSALIVPGAARYHFGILTSVMHNAWVRTVAGRMKSDPQYSNNIVYNNFPWPAPTPEQRARVEEKAQAVLAAREQFMGTAPASGAVADALVGNTEGTSTSPRARKQSARARTATAGAAVLPETNCTLADLYDPNTMPRDLLRAHTELDRAVERCYRPEPFHSDRERVEHLFRLYEQLTAPLLPAPPKARGRRSQTAATTPRQPRQQRTPGLPSQDSQEA